MKEDEQGKKKREKKGVGVTSQSLARTTRTLPFHPLARDLCVCAFVGRAARFESGPSNLTWHFNFSSTPPALFPCFYIYIEEEDCEPRARRIRILSNQCVTSSWQSFFPPHTEDLLIFSCQQKVICCIVIRPNSWVMEVHDGSAPKPPTPPRAHAF